MTRGLGTWLRVERVLLDSGRIIVSKADGDLDPSDPASKFMLRQRAQMAEYELDQIKARVRRWHEQRARHGHPNVSGARPFGYAAKDRSRVDEAEAEVIRDAAELILKGRPLHAVAAWANELGAKSPTGKEWRAHTFGNMLRSPGVAGLRAYRGEIVAAGRWTAILDRPTWERVRARLGNGNGKRKGGRPPKYLLTGVLVCAECGRHMTTGYRSRDRVRRYTCWQQAGIKPRCRKISILASPVEEIVGAEVLAHLSETGLAAALSDLGDAKADAAYAELADAETDRDGIEQMRASGAIKDDAFLRMHGPAEARVEAARRALGQVSGRSALADFFGELHADADGQVDLAELAAWWDDATTAERREVVTASLAKVIVHPSGPRMSRFDAGRVVIPPESWKV